MIDQPQSTPAAKTPVVGAVILRFNGSREMLQRAVESVVNSTESPDLQIGEVLLVDNGSTEHPEIVDVVASEIAKTPARLNRTAINVRTLHVSINRGFAAGVNAGVAELHRTCTAVLLLNDDAYLRPTALKEMVDALAHASADVVSVAPKVLLDGEDGLLESVGMCVNTRAEAQNVGLGEIDLGQFDEPLPTLGPSFGVALIRRDAFAHELVGALRESFFMYYEDVEWNWRAFRLGYRSVTAPAAVAMHAMSASSRDHRSIRSLGQDEVAYAKKHRYIERNLLWTGLELLPPAYAFNLFAHRWPRQVKGLVTGRFKRATGLAAWDSLRQLPTVLATRRRLQQRFSSVNVSAHDVFRFSPQHPIRFDPVSYQPLRSWEALRSSAEQAGAVDLARACTQQSPSAATTAAKEWKDGMYADVLHTYLAFLMH